MKTAFMQVGLALLLLGINYVVIYAIIKATKTMDLQEIRKIWKIGLVVAFVGLAIGLLAIPVWLLGDQSQGEILTKTGEDIIFLGISTVISAIGYKYANTLRNCALVTAIIGALCVIGSIFM
jgi:hypothetical protein